MAERSRATAIHIIKCHVLLEIRSRGSISRAPAFWNEKIQQYSCSTYTSVLGRSTVSLFSTRTVARDSETK